ncbi:unnamed protein product, partial [Urochloa humidicola]
PHKQWLPPVCASTLLARAPPPGHRTASRSSPMLRDRAALFLHTAGPRFTSTPAACARPPCCEPPAPILHASQSPRSSSMPTDGPCLCPTNTPPARGTPDLEAVALDSGVGGGCDTQAALDDD